MIRTTYSWKNGPVDERRHQNQGTQQEHPFKHFCFWFFEGPRCDVREGRPATEHVPVLVVRFLTSYLEISANKEKQHTVGRKRRLTNHLRSAVAAAAVEVANLFVNVAQHVG